MRVATALLWLVALAATAPLEARAEGEGAGSAAAPSATADAASEEAAPRWPHEVESAGHKVVVYQPQVETLRGDKLLARAAISVTKKDAKEPLFGAVWFEARLLMDREARTATPMQVDVKRIRFPDVAPERTKPVEELLEREMPTWDLEVNLDDLLAALAEAERERTGAEGLATTPPSIVVRDAPAILLLVDGEPRWKDAEGGLKRIINAPFFVALRRGRFWLRVGPYWWGAQALAGPWTTEPTAPDDVLALLASEPRAEEPPIDATPEKRPDVILASEPTELIVINGAPRWQVIRGTGLLYVENADADVFKSADAKKTWVLISGRWYEAATLEGPWTYVASDALPPDFARIPEGSPKAPVLVSVAGTQEAEDALIDAAIPETAAIDRKTATVEVIYDGDPVWTKVEGLEVEYAENTSFAVFRCEGKYFCCHEGVWFTAADARGPWVVADAIPPALNSLPPSCPHYSARYVTIYEATPDEVYVGYTPGYVGCYIYGPTVIYGTGWRYRWWYGRYWYPRPVTYGMAVHYNRWNGGWMVSSGVCGPHAWHGVRFSGVGGVNVGVGGGCGFWGGGVGYRRSDAAAIAARAGGDSGAGAGADAGAAGVGSAASPYFDRTGNLYARQGRWLAAATRDRLARPAVRPGGGAAGITPGPIAGPQGAPAAGVGAQSARKGRSDDVFTDRDGNVYRRGDEGWQKHGAGGWEAPVARGATPERPRPQVRPAAPPAARPQPQPEPRPKSATQPSAVQDLERQNRARQYGNQRAQGYQQYQGAQRSGGGARGGGGRRR